MVQPVRPKRSRGRPRTQSPDAEGATVQALDRGLMLLSALSKQGEVTLSELAFGVGMPPSSAHRLLVTLQKHGIAAFDETSQNWSVGVEAFRIGSAFTHRTNLVEAGREVMRHLMEETGETANLGIANDGFVVFLSQVDSPNPIRAFFRPGIDRAYFRQAMAYSFRSLRVGDARCTNTPRLAWPCRHGAPWSTHRGCVRADTGVSVAPRRATRS